MANQAIDWNFQRNIQFLEDYLQIDPATISAASREIALAHVSTKPGSTLEQLLQLTKDKIPADDIFAMIAANSLTLAPLAEPSRVEVFASSDAATKLKSSDVQKPEIFHLTTLRCGSLASWGGRLSTATVSISPETRSIPAESARQARGRLERAARTNAEEPGETPPGVHRARRERVAVQAKRQADAAAPDRAQPRGADATETVGAQRIKQGVLEVARVGEGAQL